MAVSNKELREALGEGVSQHSQDQLSELKAVLYHLAEVAYEKAVEEGIGETESKKKTDK